MTSVVDVASLSFKQIIVLFFFFFLNVCATEPACEMDSICCCQGDVCGYKANLVRLLQQLCWGLWNAVDHSRVKIGGSTVLF